ncbi:MAG: T9SS type A sorting domain-containing protein [Bacteroidetes bacterium]|nr:T9SS type A sorting domain-containing protein [Bacteroidota bacterium]
MKFLFLFTLVLISTLLSVKSQTVYFDKTYNSPYDGTEYATSVLHINGSGYLTIGFGKPKISPPHWFTFLVMIDYDGDTIWQNVLIDTSVHFYPARNSLMKTQDGNCAYCGMKRFINKGSGAEDSTYASLVKIDLNGDTIWTKSYQFNGSNVNYIYDCASTNDNGFILCGFNIDTPSNKTDLYIIKTDQQGNLLWEQTYGGVAWEYANSIQETSDGGFILTGVVSKTIFDTVVYTERRLLVMKLDSTGNKVWDQYFDYYDFTSSTSSYVHENVYGEYIVTSGYSPGGYLINMDSMSVKGYAIKLNSSGNVVWQYSYFDTINYWVDPFSGDTSITSYCSLGEVAVGLTDGSFVTVGESLTDSGYYGWLVKIDNSGKLLWKHRFYKWQLKEDNIFKDIQSTPDGGFIICGDASKNSQGLGGNDFWLIKVDSFGCLVPNCISSIATQPKSNLNINVFPNPFSHSTILTISTISSELAKNENYILNIYNVLGTRVREIDVINLDQVIIEKRNLKSGIYFLELLGDKGTRATGKIVIQ